MDLRPGRSVFTGAYWLYISALLVLAVSVALACWLLRPAVPHTITISTGQPGSSLYWIGERYAKILARNGIKLNVVTSNGSLQNLDRLLDPAQDVDVALVQGGIAKEQQAAELMSLGNVTYVPLAVFYRGKGMTALSELSGKRIAIGPVGSGTREISLKLLAANGIYPEAESVLLPSSGMQAATELINGDADAVFLSGDSATRAMMLRLYRVPGISLMDFDNARAYTRLLPYLGEIELPPGILDLGHRLPPQPLHLVAPMVELVARPNLHPALSDLLIEAAQEVHGKATVMQRAGQFPNATEYEFPISDDAKRYYRSGKSFLYRTLPFWLASATDRALVLILPAGVLVLPILKLLSSLYGWRARSRFIRFYAVLLAVERDALLASSEDEWQALSSRIDSVEKAVNELHVPLFHADALFALRQHIGLVRLRIEAQRQDSTARSSSLQGAPVHPHVDAQDA